MENNDSNITKIPGCNIATGCQAVTAVKTVSSDTAKLDEVVTYTITIRNDTVYTIEDIYLEDTLPEGITFVEGTLKLGNTPLTGNLLSGVLLPPLAPKNIHVVTFNAKVTQNQPSPKINTATVTFNSRVNGVPVPGTTTTNPVIIDIVGYQITKSVNPVNATSGDILTFTINVLSFANSTKNVIKDILPSELELVDNQILVDGNVITGNILEGIDIGPIAKGLSKTVSFKVRVK